MKLLQRRNKIPTKKNLDNLDIGKAIYNVEKKFYEPRIREVEPDKPSYSQPKKVVKTSLKRERDLIAFPSLASFKAKPLPTYSQDDIEKIIKEGSDERLEEKKEEKKSEKDFRHAEKDSDNNFYWLGDFGVKKGLIWVILALIIIIAAIIFGVFYLKGAGDGWFKDVYNQTINNTNECNVVIPACPVIPQCPSLDCGNTTNNITFSPNIIIKMNDTNSTQ